MANLPKREPKLTSVILTCIQICLELQIVGDYKTFIHKKYKNQSFTKNDWIDKLKADGIDICN